MNAETNPTKKNEQLRGVNAAETSLANDKKQRDANEKLVSQYEASIRGLEGEYQVTLA